MSYKTKQKEAILSYLETVKDRHLTINEIGIYLNQQGKSVGTTTIYRYIDQLVQEGKVKKIIIDGENAAYFQYVDCANKHDHYHMKCEKCGELFHVDCHFLDDLQMHLLSNHKFHLNVSKTIIYGKCQNCA